MAWGAGGEGAVPHPQRVGQSGPVVPGVPVALPQRGSRAAELRGGGVCTPARALGVPRWPCRALGHQQLGQEVGRGPRALRRPRAGLQVALRPLEDNLGPSLTRLLLVVF